MTNYPKILTGRLKSSVMSSLFTTAGQNFGFLGPLEGGRWPRVVANTCRRVEDALESSLTSQRVDLFFSFTRSLLLIIAAVVMGVGRKSKAGEKPVRA